MRAPPRFEDRVDLVDDHRAHGAKHLAAPSRSEEEVERLRRCREDVGRGPDHPLAFGLRGVPASHRCRDPDGGKAHFLGHLPDGPPGLLQIPVDIGAQGLERGDVDDPHLVRKPARVHSLGEEFVQGIQEGGEGLPRAGRGGDEGVLPPPDRVPSTRLCRCGGVEAGLEPAAHCGMEARQRLCREAGGLAHRRHAGGSWLPRIAGHPSRKGGRSPAVVTARGPGRTLQVWAGRSYHRVPGSRRSRALAPPAAQALRIRFTMCSAGWRRPAGFVPGCMWSSAGGLAPHSGSTSRLRMLRRIRRSRSPAVPRTDALPAVHADQGDPGLAGGLSVLGMCLSGVPHSSGRARAES